MLRQETLPPPLSSLVIVAVNHSIIGDGDRASQVDSVSRNSSRGQQQNEQSQNQFSHGSPPQLNGRRPGEPTGLNNRGQRRAPLSGAGGLPQKFLAEL